MGMDNVIFAFYSGLVCIALIVTYLSGIVLHDKVKNREFDDVFWFSLAITIGWVGTLSVRIWFSVWKFYDLRGHDIDWMVHHWFINVLIALLCAGGLLHIRTLTKSKYGEWGWITSLASAIITMIISIKVL